MTNTFGPGINTSFTSELNENFKETCRFIAQDISVHTTAATSSTLLASVNISSSIPKNGIKVTASLSAGSNNNVGDASGSFYFVVDGVIKRTASVRFTTTDTIDYLNYKTVILYDIVTDFSTDKTLAIYGAASEANVDVSLEEYFVETL